MELPTSPTPVSPRPADPFAPYPAITAEQTDQFNAITSGEYSNLCLMSVLLDGQPTVAICAVVIDGESYDMHPLYIAVDDAIFARLLPPPIDDEGTLPVGVPS